MKVRALEKFENLIIGSKLLIESTNLKLPQIALVTVVEPNYIARNHIAVAYEDKVEMINLKNYFDKKGPVKDIFIVEIGME